MTRPPPARPTLSPARPSRSRPSLGITLMLAMLAVVLLSVGSTFMFSNLAVQREFRKLPPEVQELLRAQEEAARRGEVIISPPIPEIRTGTPADPYLPPDFSSPDVGGVILNPTGDNAVIQEGRWQRGRDTLNNRTVNARRFTPRTQDFLRDVQQSLLQVGLVAALASALLGYLLSRRLARPITAVSLAAQQLARGDLNARAPLLSGEREVAELAHTFNEMAANLQTLERERQQAVADIAHELRTPIAVMQARLDALEDGLYPMSAEQIALLSAQTQLLTRLVGDLRTLTIAEAGRLHLHPEAVDLADLTAQVVRDLGDQASARHLHLHLHAASSPIRADPVRVRQITTNLIQNALQHARQQVTVTVEPSGSDILLHVDDDGPGIPQDNREAVFARFTRLDESRNRHTGGSGLGLAIVQALANAHGGQAQVSAGQLGGARFTVRLPVR